MPILTAAMPRLALLLLLQSFASTVAAEPVSALPGYCGIGESHAAPPVERQHGFADIESGRPYGLHTIQPIGSVSKTFIGLAIAQLLERGVLDLDTPVDAVLGWPVRNPRHPTRPITLRQLATHTSGIHDNPSDYRRAYLPATDVAPSLAAYLQAYFQPADRRLLKHRFSTARPGQRYEYSNLGAALAALVVERRSGQPFADYVRDNILLPLKMSDSSYPGFGDNAAADQLAALYEHVEALAPYRLVTYPDGGLRSSCSDLSRYAQAVLRAFGGQSSALPASTVRRMLQPQWTRPPAGAPAALRNHGLFWEYKASGAIGHSGGDPGISALLAIEPARQQSRVQLTNTGIDEAPAAAAAFLRQWQQLDAAPMP